MYLRTGELLGYSDGHLQVRVQRGTEPSGDAGGWPHGREGPGSARGTGYWKVTASM